MFGRNWTRYFGSYSWFPCDLEEPCDYKGCNWAGTHSTIGHPVAAATTVKSVGILLIVVVPLAPLPNSMHITGTVDVLRSL